MKVSVGIGCATISDADGMVSDEQFTRDELEDMADFLDRVTPSQVRIDLAPAMRRLSDLLSALINDTDAFIITVKESLE